MLIISYISFFFSGGNDYSIVVQADARQDMRNEIQNALGLPGAVISRWLIDGTFGIVSLAALVALALYSVRLIVYFPLKKLRLLFIVLFILVWGSIMLGFVQQQLGIGSFFRWGGAFGQIVAQWGTSYVQWIGMTLIIMATLIIFLVIIDKHFVEHCQQMGNWMVGLFSKKTTLEESTSEETETITIDIQPITTTQDPEFIEEEEEPTPTIKVDVETPQEEIIIEEEQKKENEDVEISVVDVSVKEV